MAHAEVWVRFAGGHCAWRVLVARRDRVTVLHRDHLALMLKELFGGVGAHSRGVPRDLGRLWRRVQPADYVFDPISQ